jgi:hypothetical protein
MIIEEILTTNFVKKTTRNIYVFFYQTPQKPIPMYYTSPRLPQINHCPTGEIIGVLGPSGGSS